MKITLFAPAARDLHDRPIRMATMPHMTLPYLAALVPPGHNVKIVDETVDTLDLEEPCDLFAISATTATIAPAYRVADQLRSRGVKVVIGGAHATFRPREAAEHADSVVVGEAEEAWPRLIRDLERNELEPSYEMPGPRSLAGLPRSRFDLVNYRRYLKQPRRKTPIVPIWTARGCPHRCDFCAAHRLYGNVIRYRPVDEVVAEVRASGADSIFLADENLFMNPKRATELLDALEPLGLAIHFQTDTDLVRHPELVERAARAGCASCFVGFESLSEANLTSVGKEFVRPEAFGAAIKLLHDHGIGVFASVIAGFDEDDPRSVAATADFFIEHGTEIAYFWPLVAFPGTSLYDRLCQEGRLRDERWWLKPASDPLFMGHIARRGPSSYELYALAMQRFYSMSSIARRCLRSSRPVTSGLTNLVTAVAFFRHGMNVT